jgi:anti-anti-sigma factor
LLQATFVLLTPGVEQRTPKGEGMVAKPSLELKPTTGSRPVCRPTVRHAVAKPALGVVADISLSIQIIHDRRAARLVPIGELDVHSASTFGIAAQLAVAERPEQLHLDLSQVTFIDSSGARGVYALVALAAESGVPCTISGREELFDRPSGERDSFVVWSGSTTRRVEVPVDLQRGG